MSERSLVLTDELVAAAREAWMASYDTVNTLDEKLAELADGAKLLAYAALFLAYAKKLDVPHLEVVLGAAHQTLGSDTLGNETRH